MVQSSGRVILDRDESNDSEYIGFCAQDNILIPDLTTREHLEIYARIKLREGIAFEVENILEKLNFGIYENYRASQLSGGYQKRLCVALAFLGVRYFNCKITIFIDNY